MAHKSGKLYCSFHDRLASLDDASLERRLGSDLAADFKSGAYTAKEWKTVPQSASFGIDDLKANDMASFQKFRDGRNVNP